MVTTYHSFSSVVVKGKAIGRTIGYPTANLELPSGSNFKFGVYFATINIDNLVYFGLVSIGIRPTIEGESRANAECYLLDFRGDLYGKELRVELLEYMRGEIKFGTLEELREQIQSDELKARELMLEYAQ